MSNALLLDVDDTVLIVIDVQLRFASKLPATKWRPIVARICWLIRAAAWLGVPPIVTAEDIPRLGGVHDDIALALPANAVVFNKMVFGLGSDLDILAAIERTERRTAVLVGFETDVCVAQSALGLLNRGYQVAVVSDCTGSAQSGHEAGLRRAERAGAAILPVRSVVYEWLRSVDRARQFSVRVTKDGGAPDGVVL